MRSPRALLLALLLASAPPAAAAEEDGLPVLLAPLDLGTLARRGEVEFRHSEGDLGSPADAFDGKPGTVFRTRSVNPAFLEATFTRPREVLSAEAFLPGGDPHEWSLLAGDDPEALRVLFERRRTEPDSWSRVEKFGKPVRARVWRVVVKRLSGEDSVQFGEVALQARQKPAQVDLVAPSFTVCPSGSVPLRARVVYDGGHRSTTADGLAFDVEEDSPIRLEPVGPRDPASRMARYERTGQARVRVLVRGKPGVEVASPWVEMDCRSDGKPDWSVTHVERTPRLDYDDPRGGLPDPGSAVLWKAHVRNYGTVDAQRVPVLWQVDGKEAATGWLEGLSRFEEGESTLRLPWDGERHDLRFVVDPAGAVEETSEGNNARTVQTDALLLGLWVERPLPAWFHRTQSRFGDGANGFEDWAQRQVDRWNGLLARSVHPLVPGGCTDRIALDSIVVVEEGGLPVNGGIPSNDPDAGDRTVDLQWGFPAPLLEGERLRRVGEKDGDNPLWLDGELLRDLSRARGLADLGRLDVPAREVVLDAPDGSPLAGSPWLPLVGPGLVRRSRSGRMTAGDFSGYSEHEACALERNARRRAEGGNRLPPPSSGLYLADLPSTVGIRVLAADGRPLDEVRVLAWRRSPGPRGEAFRGEPVREGETADGGVLDLVSGGKDPFFEGRREGPLDAGRGVLLLELSRGGKSCWRFLEVVPYNLAFWRGAKSAHFEEVPTNLPR